MASLICGSIAFDTIMSFEGRFKEQILPDQLHILNVAFLVPHMRREFGGCAGNIGYNLKLLGGEPLVMASVGIDASSYFDQMAKYQISTEFVQEIADAFTAQAMITTDRDNNQITAFHPGAMDSSHLNDALQAIQQKKSSTNPIRLGIVAPDGRQGMIMHAKQFTEAAIPFIFDPGQGLPMFDGKELEVFIEQASYIAVNDYEGEMLAIRTGLSLKTIAQRVQALKGQMCMSTVKYFKFLPYQLQIPLILPVAVMRSDLDSCLVLRTVLTGQLLDVLVLSWGQSKLLAKDHKTIRLAYLKFRLLLNWLLAIVFSKAQ